jgi:hypothetical protein
MRIKTTVVVVLAAGLLAAGCGGVDISVEEQSTLATRKDALPSCDGLAFERVFYSDASLTQVTGHWFCYCGDNTVWAYGNWRSPYSQDFNVQECGYDVPDTSVRTAFTCHDDCRFGCFERYPDDTGMQNLCTWSCIDSECGGGPFPLR